MKKENKEKKKSLEKRKSRFPENLKEILNDDSKLWAHIKQSIERFKKTLED